MPPTDQTNPTPYGPRHVCRVKGCANQHTTPDCHGWTGERLGVLRETNCPPHQILCQTCYCWERLTRQRNVQGLKLTPWPNLPIRYKPSQAERNDMTRKL